MATARLDHDAATAFALRQAGVRPEQVRAVHGGPDSNAVVVMTATRVVKVASAAPLNVQAEPRMWAAARALGIPAPELIEAAADAGPSWLSYRLIEGSSDALSPHALREAGGHLARLHRASPNEFPDELSARPRRHRRLDLARAFFRGAGRTSGDAVWALLDAAEDDWHHVHTVPTHGDFRSSNLLARAGRLVGIVDWSEGMRSSRERDIGSLDAAALPEVLAGYRAAGGRIKGRVALGHLAARYGALAASGVIPVRVALGAVTNATTILTSSGDYE